MSKKTLLFGAIASVLTINSVIADTVVTSQTYVDNADALKQDKITAGTTGNVVLYNGTQNGQTQFSERAIYDGTNDYDETTDANKLITAGAVDGMVGDVYDYVDDEISNIPAPELPTGQPNYVVTYDEDGNVGGERGIYEYGDENSPDKLITANEAYNAAYSAAGTVLEGLPSLTCEDADCTLFRVSSTLVKPSCTNSGAGMTKCINYCRGGAGRFKVNANCVDGVCECNLCRKNDEPCTNDSQCCSSACGNGRCFEP